jgi:hypothetical protein
MLAAGTKLTADLSSRPSKFPSTGRVPLHGQWVYQWRITCPRLVIVTKIALQQSPNVPFIQNHNVVQTLPSNRANQPLGKCVLPRTPRCSDNLLDSERLDSTAKLIAIAGVAVTDQVPRSIPLGKVSLIKTSCAFKINKLQRGQSKTVPVVFLACSRHSGISSAGFSAHSAHAKISSLRTSLFASSCWLCTPSDHAADYPPGTSCFGSS